MFRASSWVLDLARATAAAYPAISNPQVSQSHLARPWPAKERKCVRFLVWLIYRDGRRCPESGRLFMQQERTVVLCLHWAARTPAGRGSRLQAPHCGSASAWASATYRSPAAYRAAGPFPHQPVGPACFNRRLTADLAAIPPFKTPPPVPGMRAAPRHSPPWPSRWLPSPHGTRSQTANAPRPTW